MAKLGVQMSNVKVDLPDLSKVQREVEALHKQLAQQHTLDELEDLQSRLGQLQAVIGEALSKAGEKQSHLGGLQSALGEKQAELGEKQAKLGEQQAKIEEEAEKKIRRLFEEAIRDGRAKPVR
jgi:predicted  nucleic acid-binding Zn-ribbon protein